MFEGGIETWTCIYGWVYVQIVSVSGKRSALALIWVLAVPCSQSSCQEGNSRLCQVYLLTISSPLWVLQRPHQFLTLYKGFGFLVQNWSFHYYFGSNTRPSASPDFWWALGPGHLWPPYLIFKAVQSNTDHLLRRQWYLSSFLQFCVSNVTTLLFSLPLMVHLFENFSAVIVKESMLSI